MYILLICIIHIIQSQYDNKNPYEYSMTKKFLVYKLRFNLICKNYSIVFEKISVSLPCRHVPIYSKYFLSTQLLHFYIFITLLLAYNKRNFVILSLRLLYYVIKF